MISVFSSPSRYTQGKHATAELGGAWKESLRSAGITPAVYPLGGAWKQRHR